MPAFYFLKADYESSRPFFCLSFSGREQDGDNTAR